MNCSCDVKSLRCPTVRGRSTQLSGVAINPGNNHRKITCNSLKIEGSRLAGRLDDLGEILTHLAINCPRKSQCRKLNYSDELATALRLKAIMRIYQTVLKASPLNCRFSCGKNLDGTFLSESSTPTSVILASQQVLQYIESLPGYCDLINSLRLILKSTTMLNVMFAYTTLISMIKENPE